MFLRVPKKLNDGLKGSVIKLLKMPIIWSILILMMVPNVPAAGLKGLKAGPNQKKLLG